jgi:ATP-dependent protease ClpP protease subunit
VNTITGTVIKALLVAGIAYFIGMKAAGAQVAMNEKVMLNSNNMVLLRGEVNEDSIGRLELDLAKVVAKRLFKDYPIYLVIDSPGGEVDTGLDFIEVAKLVPNLRTIVIFGASMAADITESLPGERMMTNKGVLMFHRARGQFQGQFEVGELESRFEFAKKQILDLETTVANRLKMSIFEFKGHAKDEWWLNAKEAVQYKAADKIVDISCSQELIDKRTEITQESIFGTFTMVYSNCPTFRLGFAKK